MNKKFVFYILGRILVVEAILLLLPTICSAIYHETSIFAFLITMGIALILGLTLIFLNRKTDKTMYAKEGFAIVSLAWIIVSVIGCLPFVISREIPSFVDAFFETVSGFTTTGASIVPNVEILSRGILFWRSFTHWVGGMGILVFVMAIIPTNEGRSMHIMRAEMPGPIIGKFVPKMASTAKILYMIYIAMTFVLTLFLIAGKMPVFDSILHAFGAAGTGGFGIKSNSIAGYSPYIQWVLTFGMLAFGVNFNIYYLILLRKISLALKSEELLTYLSIFVITTSLVTYNIFTKFADTETLSDAIRHAAFQVSSILTTTGYATTNFDLWPAFSKVLILMLMVCGACAGSTAGGYKVSRAIMLFKVVKGNLKHMLHPRSVDSVRFEGKTVEKETISNITAYLGIYCFCVVAIFILISFDPFSVETHLSATLACFNNIGPGLDAVGPASNYSLYSDFSKLALSAAMLLGRLEILPLILLFSPSTWIKIKKRKK